MVTDITTSMALCSSSPTTFSTSPHATTSCPVLEMDFSARMNTTHNAVSKPVIAGLTALLATSNTRHCNPCTSDPLDLASASNSFARGCYSDSWSGLESLAEPTTLASPSSAKMKEWSPIAVLQGPFSYCSSGQGSHKLSSKLLLLDPQFDSTVRLCCLTADPHQSYLWQEDVRGSCGMPQEYLGSFSQPQRLLPEAPELATGNMGKTAQDVLLDAQAAHEIFKDPFVIRAFQEAESAHRGQYRLTGDLFLVHCVETAMLLAAVGATKEVVVAGLLHDIVDDSATDYTELQEMFGKQVAYLVEGVSKMSEVSKLARDNETASKSLEADRLHTMLLAMADVRVVLIKLADRLHNMRTLVALSESKQLRIAKETLQIFVPLANRLGIWSWKAELEDLCFKHLKPEVYQILEDKLSGNFRQSSIVAAIEKLEKNLLEEGVLYHDLSGRRKNLYGIYTKMMRNGKNLEEVFDLQGLRLVVSDKEDCYAALDIVHRLWPQMRSNVKDYIKQPKANGYMSLHTIVQGEDGLPLELQIRTEEMHHQAEFGVAAHWRYKEDDVEHSPFILQMVAWARWMLSGQSEIMETRSRLPFKSSGAEIACPFPDQREGFAHAHFHNLLTLPQKQDDPLFVIILEHEKMVVQELPAGSTVADLLHKRCIEDSFVATGGVGLCEELRPRVNHKMVEDIQQILRMGDLVEMTPLIANTSLVEYRNKIKRMYGDRVPQDGRHVVQILP